MLGRTRAEPDSKILSGGFNPKMGPGGGEKGKSRAKGGEKGRTDGASEGDKDGFGGFELEGGASLSNLEDLEDNINTVIII